MADSMATSRVQSEQDAAFVYTSRAEIEDRIEADRVEADRRLAEARAAIDREHKRGLEEIAEREREQVRREAADWARTQASPEYIDRMARLEAQVAAERK